MHTSTRRALLACMAFIASGCTEYDRTDISAIEALMRATWDRPDAPLTVGPIAVDSDFAIADWTQGHMGGRALLTKRDGTWRVILCAGDGIRNETGLVSVGIPGRTATALARELAELERDAEPERLAAMARFAGIVRMDEQPPRPH